MIINIRDDIIILLCVQSMKLQRTPRPHALFAIHPKLYYVQIILFDTFSIRMYEYMLNIGISDERAAQCATQNSCALFIFAKQFGRDLLQAKIKLAPKTQSDFQSIEVSEIFRCI